MTSRTYITYQPEPNELVVTRHTGSRASLSTIAMGNDFAIYFTPDCAKALREVLAIIEEGRVELREAA